jgi:hypothetical protein
MPLDKLQSDAQSVLDDLWTSKLIPFELRAYKVESLGMDEYIIRFQDSRLRSIDISSKKSQCFKDAVRIAVTARVARLSGSLQKPARIAPPLCTSGVFKNLSQSFFRHSLVRALCATMNPLTYFLQRYLMRD